MAVDIEQRQRLTAPPPSKTLRLVGFLPAAAFLATFGLFVLDKNREARTVLKSGRGLLTVVVIVIGYVAVGMVLRRTVRWAWVPPLVLTAAVLSLAAWIVRPYYVDETANRKLVTAPIGEEPDTTSRGRGAEPSQPRSQGAVRLGTGQLSGIDHDAAGDVSLLRTPAGSQVVRFETFDIEGVPDPQLYLVNGDDIREPGGIHLGRLPGNRGDVLDIAVPEATDAGSGWTVLVWCRSFSVPIANATLAPG